MLAILIAFSLARLREFFPEIIAERFDFFKDDFETILSKLNIEFDIAVFFGSAYVMNDEQFTKLFRALKKNDVKKIIDFHAGYMDGKGMIFNCLKYFTNNSKIRKMVTYHQIVLEDIVESFMVIQEVVVKLENYTKMEVFQ